MSFKLDASIIKERILQSRNKGNVINVNGSFIRIGEFVLYQQRAPGAQDSESEEADSDSTMLLGQVVDIEIYINQDHLNLWYG